YVADLKFLGPNGNDCTDPTKVDSQHACLADVVLGCGTQPCIKGAYTYTLGSTAATLPITDYTASAYPTGTTGGTKSYCSNPDAVIRFEQKVANTAYTVDTCKVLGALPN
ncbi:MAG: hypothetical protein ACRD4F_15275, partial [Candidatus Angelobacter sp.]